MTLDPIIIVDGSGYLYRAFHALPPLETQAGQHTGAIYGMITMLNKLLETYPTQQIVVVLDSPSPTFRHILYPDYKAHRGPMADELSSQIEWIKTMIPALGLPLVCLPGVEADDIIGTLALQANQYFPEKLIYIVTNDKDFAQIVSPQILLVNTLKNEILDPAGVEQKFGVRPEQIIDYLSLMGDTSDNVPGIPKVGPKTAAKWLQQYGTIHNLYQHADQISGKVGESLRASKSQVQLAQSLVQLQTDLELPVHIQDCVRSTPDPAKLFDYYSKLEFKSLSQKLLNQYPEQIVVTQTEPEPIPPETVLSPDSECFIALCSELRRFQSGELILELDYSNHLFLISCPDESKHIHHAIDVGKISFEAECFELLRTHILSNPNILLIGSDLKSIFHALTPYALHLKPLNITCQLFDLDIAAHYLGQKPNYPLLIKQDPQQLELLKTIEFPLIPVLYRMEYTGISLATEQLKQYSLDLNTELTILSEKILELAGESFNINSPKQLQTILYDTLQLPILEKTPSGQPSTSEFVLTALQPLHPLPGLLLEYRHLNKLQSTYTDTLIAQVNPDTQRIHTTFNQAITSTGRLSSSDPNLQNIPIRMESGRKIRNMFVAAPGYCLLVADYSQIELRIMAYFSQDPGLIQAFLNQQDIHRQTAASLFQCPESAVTPDQRRIAKAVNFGLMYGMSSFGLAKQLNIARPAADKLINLYFEKFPGVARYMESTRTQAKQNHYVQTLRGRKLYLADIQSRNFARQAGAIRAAINAPLQGTNAELIKQAMIQIDHWIQSNGLSDSVRLILQVHDELVFELKPDMVQIAQSKIQAIMESIAEPELHLSVSIGIAQTWGEAH